MTDRSYSEYVAAKMNGELDRQPLPPPKAIQHLVLLRRAWNANLGDGVVLEIEDLIRWRPRHLGNTESVLTEDGWLKVNMVTEADGSFIMLDIHPQDITRWTAQTLLDHVGANDRRLFDD